AKHRVKLTTLRASATDPRESVLHATRAPRPRRVRTTRLLRRERLSLQRPARAGEVRARLRRQTQSAELPPRTDRAAAESVPHSAKPVRRPATAADRAQLLAAGPALRDRVRRAIARALELARRCAAARYRARA